MRAQRSQIVKPIFVLGVERSGTTVLYSMLSNHDDLYWFSRLEGAFPYAPATVSAVRRLIQTFAAQDAFYQSIPETISRSSGLLGPSEGGKFWRSVFDWDRKAVEGKQDDYYDEDDIDQETDLRWVNEFRIRMRVLKKSRLLLKQPGLNVRLRYLNPIFPDSLFVHVIRNPWDNIASLAKAKSSSKEMFWGTKMPGWRRFLPFSYEDQAGVQLEGILTLIRQQVAGIPLGGDRYTSVRLEDLIDDPEGVTRSICEFCSLNFSERLRKAVRSVAPKKMSKRGTLSSPTANAIAERIARKYGYL